MPKVPKKVRDGEGPELNTEQKPECGVGVGNQLMGLTPGGTALAVFP